jgi:hypothetical protein
MENFRNKQLISYKLCTAKKNEILSFAGKWMELENIFWLRRPKITCPPSDEDYRAKTNVAVLLDMGHPKGRLCMGETGQGKETKNLNAMWMKYSVCRNE